MPEKPSHPNRLKGLSAIFCGVALLLGLNGCDGKREQPGAPPPTTPENTQPVTQPEPPVPVGKPIPVPACEVYRPDVNHDSRALTPGEKRLAQTLFGDKLDLSCAKLNFFPARSRGGPLEVAADEKSNVEFYGKTYASNDFSGEGRAKFGAFITAMTYLWQNQTNEADTRGLPNETGYPLDSQYSFQDYGWQQQAEIMEDYALRFLHPSRRSRWLPDDYGGDRLDTDPFLQALVENYFPAAKDAREAFAQVETRFLTTGEDQLIRSIFGTMIDTDSLQVNFHPERYTDAAATADSSSSADFWGKDQKSGDFSQDRDVDRWATFIHEFTHVWQFQTNRAYTVDDSGDETDINDEYAAYRYPLSSKYKFTDYGVEQQAAIVEDYARRFLSPAHETRYLPMVYGHKGAAAKDPLLMKVVEDQFPQARLTRLALSQPKTAAVSRRVAAGPG